MRDVQSEKLGNRFLLYAPATGAILTTDVLGRALLRGLASGCSLSRIAASLRPADMPPGLPGGEARVAVLNAIVASWAEAGLLSGDPLPFPDPVTDDGRAAPILRTYATRFGTIHVETDDAHLAGQLDAILARMMPDDGMPDDGGTTRTPGGTGTRFRCMANGDPNAAKAWGAFRDGLPLAGRMTRDEARFVILIAAAEDLCGGADRVGAVLHGGAVSGAAGAIALCGTSGRGKSTLTQGLVAAGCGYLCDDHVPIAADGTSLLAFPVSAGVKPGAAGLPEVRKLEARCGFAPSGRDGVRYLRLPPGGDPGSPMPVRAIVFPGHQPGARLDLQRLSPEDAFSAAVAGGAWPARSGRRIAPLARLFDTVPAYRLVFGTSDQSVPACLSLLEE